MNPSIAGLLVLLCASLGWAQCPDRNCGCIDKTNEFHSAGLCEWFMWSEAVSVKDNCRMFDTSMESMETYIGSCAVQAAPTHYLGGDLDGLCMLPEDDCPLACAALGDGCQECSSEDMCNTHYTETECSLEMPPDVESADGSQLTKGDCQAYCELQEQTKPGAGTCYPSGKRNCLNRVTKWGFTSEDIMGCQNECESTGGAHGSLGVSIDTTGSMSDDQSGVITLSNNILDAILASKFEIPQFVLTTFNDSPSENVEDNVELRVDTADATEFRNSLNSISFGGGSGELAERATQGMLVTMQTLQSKAVMLVFTDAGSMNLELKEELIRLRDEKDIKIFIILAPAYNGGTVGDASWQMYQELATPERVKNMADVTAEEVIAEIVAGIGDNCDRRY